MRKVDKAISFVEGNYCMINSCRCQSDDNDIVDYILRILRAHKINLDKEKRT